jgi:asparagine synthase (glutamine-hydrolysing)
MCGFVAVITRDHANLDVCEPIHHRGPDSCRHLSLRGDSWGIDLHFRRLAIVDLDSRSDQPFGSDATGWLVYNGEIYNAEELRAVLRGRGRTFATTGDTEVLHSLLGEQDWLDLLARVDGMYSFIFIERDGTVRYGRDRVGIKPLYAALDNVGNVTALASEIEPLKRAGLAGSVDVSAVAAAALFLWVPPPGSGWTHVRHVSPGTVTTVPQGIAALSASVALPPRPSATMTIREAVRESLRRQVKADVPVALLLSGGLDSTWLACELQNMGINVPLLSARALNPRNRAAEPFADDAPFAAGVAAQLGQRVTWFDLDDRMIQGIPEMVSTVEQPFGDPAAITLMGLSRAAREHATVLLSGVGVEEVFFGYERYQAIKALTGMRRAITPLRLLASLAGTRPQLRERVSKFERMLVAKPADWPWLSQSYYAPDAWRTLVRDIPIDDVTERHRKMTQELLSRGRSLLDTAGAVDRALFLPGLNLMYADRASMAASVELRVPFLGDPVLSSADVLPGRDHVGIGRGKRRFREAAASAGVPDFVLRRSKSGLGAPVRTILRLHGAEVWRGVAPGRIFDELISREAVDAMFRAHISGEGDYGLHLFGISSLATWWEANVDGDGSIAGHLAGFKT